MNNVTSNYSALNNGDMFKVVGTQRIFLKVSEGVLNMGDFILYVPFDDDEKVEIIPYKILF